MKPSLIAMRFPNQTAIAPHRGALRRRRIGLVIASLPASMLGLGCSRVDRTVDDEFAELEYTVGMPVAVSSDPGKLTTGPIVPPDVDLPAEGYVPVSMRLRGVPAPAGITAPPVQTEPVATETAKIEPTAGSLSDLPHATEASETIAMLDPVSAPSTDDSASQTTTESGATEGASAGGALSKGPSDHNDWPKPDLTLVVTGNQHGYIEPCGCTGLDRQKGGVARRFTFLKMLRDQGWNLAPIDVGNQVRRFGAQSEIKLLQTVEALGQMGYASVGIGPDDVRLGVGPMLAVAAGGPDDSVFCSANVVLFDESMMESFRMIDSGGMKVGVTSLLEPDAIKGSIEEEITVVDPSKAAAAALKQINAAGAQYRVAMYFGDEDRARELMREVPGYDLVVVSGGYGEPTYEPMTIEGSQTKMIVTGNKGMYAGLVGLYSASPMRYSRVALTHDFKDAPEMRSLMADYQEQLRQVGFDGLGLMPPIPHSSGNQFVGSATCGKCHTSAMDVWENSMHAEATAHLVEPPAERGDVARHFDPECLSCHVTGWNPQEYYPYQSGYLSLEQTAHLTGNGCENCHGPGAAHSAAEAEGSDVAEAKRDMLRAAMRLPLEQAREKCMQCHDLDNSPDFHDEDAFEEIYWPEVEHYGLD